MLPLPPAAYADTGGSSMDAGTAEPCTSSVEGYSIGESAAANVFSAKMPHPVGVVEVVDDDEVDEEATGST